jgi:hypothetical protein
MRIICAPLLFVDAVGTLVPTNAEDRNANAIFVLVMSKTILMPNVVARLFLGLALFSFLGAFPKTRKKRRKKKCYVLRGDF